MRVVHVDGCSYAECVRRARVRESHPLFVLGHNLADVGWWLGMGSALP